MCAVFVCLPAHLDGEVRAGARLGQPALYSGPTVPSCQLLLSFKSTLPNIPDNNIEEIVLYCNIVGVFVQALPSFHMRDHFIGYICIV